MIKKNIWKYLIGQPCLIYENDNDTNPVPSFIEGYDNVADLVISERTTYKPSQIKPLLKDLDGITDEHINQILNFIFVPVLEKPVNIVFTVAYRDSKTIIFHNQSFVFYLESDFGLHVSDNGRIFNLSQTIKNNVLFYLLDNGFDVFNLIEKKLAKIYY